MDGKELGEKIATHRKACGFTLQELGDLVGSSKAYVWELENGRCTNPSLSVVKRMANAFGYTVSGFIGESPVEVKNGRKVRELAESIVKLTY